MARKKQVDTTKAVVIATRKEPLLEWTVKNVRAQWSGQIIVVHDGWEQHDDCGCGEVHMSSGPKAIGCPGARHAGIVRAREIGCDLVIVIDAHMSFRPGCLDGMAEYARQHQTEMVGCWSGVITWNHLEAPTAIHRNGARIHYLSPDGNVFEREWVKTDHVPTEAAETQCLLGACYAFTVDRYFAIGAPWDGAYGWGASEQALCMFNAFAGGSSTILPLVANHCYRDAPGSVVPYQQEPEMHGAGKVLNKIRLVQMLPIPEPVRVELMDQLRRSPEAGRRYTMAREIWERSPRKDAGIEWPVSFEEYRERWWAAAKVEEKPMQEIKPMPAIRTRRVRFRKVGNGKFEATEKPNKCPRCGSESCTVQRGSVHMGRKYKRYRKCDVCLRSFVTLSKR